MNLFEAVKTTVHVRDAAERYGLQVSRNGMARCPFHDDHTPSLKLNEKYFYCFGCQTTGDVIDLTARLFDLRPVDAAKKLAADFGLDPNRPPSRSAILCAAGKRQLQREQEQLCCSVLTGYLRLLRIWERKYAPQTPDAPVDERFIAACQQKTQIEYLADIFILGGPDERRETARRLIKGGTIYDIKQKLRKEVGQLGEWKEEVA